jgi:hypothetical protein
MTGIAELHAQALDATGRILRGVPADCWHAATPGADWDARALVNHPVSGNLWAAELAADGTIEGVGSRLDGDLLDGDLLGDDPAAAHGPAADGGLPTDRRAAGGSVPQRGRVRPRGGGPGGHEHTNRFLALLGRTG